MSKLLNLSLKKLILYAGLVLIISMPVYYKAISMLWQYELKEHNIILTPEASREDSFLIVGAVTLVTILFFTLLLVGFILINRSIARKLWQPFYQSLNQITSFDLSSRKTIVFEKTNIDEFNELNNGLNQLIAANIAAYNQQKEFADNASHELQTPLAIVQSKLDLLLQSRSLTREQYHIIEEALAAVSRVNRINKNLLLLTRIENSQFMEKEAINFSCLLDNNIQLFNNFLDDKQIQLSTHVQPNVLVEGNKILIEILLNNLLTNAIRHSDAHSKITVTLTKQEMTIANTGTHSLHPDQLFKRFSTATPQSPGTGLGLALVKQISNRYHWHVGYEFKNGLHLFSIRF